MRYKKKLFIGLITILLGLLLNKYFIEKFAPDQNIKSLSYVIHIIIFQFLLILYGVYLILNKAILKKVYIILFCLFLSLSVINGIKFLYIIVRGENKDSEKSQAQIMLDRVISLEDTKIAELSQETGEILYSIHQNGIPLATKVPENGILDTAIGIEPLLKKLFIGDVYFELLISLKDKDSIILFKKNIELSALSEKEFAWQKVSIDLSEYSGMEIKLYFNKGYKIDSRKKPKIAYDLLPTDLTYWRYPIIRPKKLKNKYNVILILLDALRADHLHFMGYFRKTTPNLDKLAQNGIYFTTVGTQAPWTTPSIFSIFTSTYPSVHKGNQPIQISYRHWNDTLPTMASILRDRGYVTAAFTGRGSISAKFGLYKGFDFYNETDVREAYGKDAEPIFNQSMKWLNDIKDRTFLLFIHTYEIHFPYCDEFFVREEKIKESETIKYRTAKYDGDIRRADFFLGKLIEKLNDLQLLDNTLIVITADHGEDLGGRNPPEATIQYGHGYNLYDDLLLVPLIFYNPKIIPHGKQIDYQVRLIDIFPTILEYLEYKEESGFQGKSLKGMIEGYDQISRPVYSEATTYGTERESIRANGYKYIHRISYGQLSHPTSKGMLLTPLHELYDLNKDPDEKINLAEKQKDKIKEFQNLILSIFPERSFKDYKEDLATKGIDINKDKKLIKILKSLGYIK